MSYRISNILTEVMSKMRSSSGLSSKLLDTVCAEHELEQINSINQIKENAFIYISSNAVLYSLSLKEDKIINKLNEYTETKIKKIIFKIGEFHGS